eukprot:4885568-Amphidinium_carterae.1
MERRRFNSRAQTPTQSSCVALAWRWPREKTELLNQHVLETHSLLSSEMGSPHGRTRSLEGLANWSSPLRHTME